MTRIKICGITNLDDALAAVTFGADALGFVFAQSPRRLEPEDAGRVIKKLPPFVCTAGVFADQDLDFIRRVKALCRLDYVQLCGNEAESMIGALTPGVIRTVHVKDKVNRIPALPENAYPLLDTYSPLAKGGTGGSFNWDLIRRAKIKNPFILAGGLTPDNVPLAIQTAKPYAVDVSSGVEYEPGRKDHDKLARFIAAARGAASPA